MDKKLIIIIVMIFLIIFATLGYVTFSNKNTVTIGSSSFSIPDEYVVKNVTNHAAILKNNDTKISVEEMNKSLPDIIKKYKDKHQNETVEDGSLDVNGLKITSLTLKKDNNKTARTLYLFEKNGKNYQIVVTGKNNLNDTKFIVESLK